MSPEAEAVAGRAWYEALMDEEAFRPFSPSDVTTAVRRCGLELEWLEQGDNVGGAHPGAEYVSSASLGEIDRLRCGALTINVYRQPQEPSPLNEPASGERVVWVPAHLERLRVWAAFSSYENVELCWSAPERTLDGRWEKLDAALRALSEA
jgi:hypothetical protein